MKNRIKAFQVALKGISTAIQGELHMKIHLLATCVCVVLGFILHLSPLEWVAILFCIALVIVSELINTAIELLCNKIHPDYDLDIGKVKDISSGAVLFASIISAIIGLIIFLPKLF